MKITNEPPPFILLNGFGESVRAWNAPNKPENTKIGLGKRHGRTAHILRIDADARERQRGERIHNHIDPQHLHDGYGGIEADERRKQRYAHRAEIHRKLKHHKLP